MWCICNNTGCIFIKAIDLGYFDIEELAVCCPICNEEKNKINVTDLVNLIYKSIQNNKRITKFRLNSYQFICLSESLKLNFESLEDNNFRGIPIELDNEVEKIEIDYLGE